LDAAQEPYLAVVDGGRDLATPAALLDDALMKCDSIVVVWSRSAANAPWVTAEWRAFFRLNGAAGCEVIPLDGTPFPDDVGGTVYEAPPALNGTNHRGPSSQAALETRAGTLLYVTRSPGGEEGAEAVASQATKLGYDVRASWHHANDPSARLGVKDPGDWVLVAADPAHAPEKWEAAFGDDPDRYPRRLVLRVGHGRVPTLLQLSPELPAEDHEGITSWLKLPSRGDLFRLLSLRRDPWTRLARRLHDGLVPNFSWIDSRLRFIDPRLRRSLNVLRASAIGAALIAHLICGALTFCLPLCAPSTTRRNLVLSATMVVFGGIAVESACFAAAVGIAVYGGLLGATAVLIAGLFTRKGMPGVGFGAGLILATIAATDAGLAPRKRYLRNRPQAAAISALLPVGVVAAAVLLGGLALLRAGNVNHAPPSLQILWGLLFGLIGGGTVGGALGWLRLQLSRRRDARKTLRLAVWGVLVGMPVAALATLFSEGDRRPRVVRGRRRVETIQARDSATCPGTGDPRRRPRG
jgi:hypothetical protein